MSEALTHSSDVAFTPAVKAIQSRKGSREAYARVEAGGGWRAEIDADLAARLAEANSFYLATAPPTGSPISSTGAARRDSSVFSTRIRSPSPITAATGNTSRKAIFPKMPRPISSSWIMPVAAG
jgi:hypothetical protein